MLIPPCGSGKLPANHVQGRLGIYKGCAIHNLQKVTVNRLLPRHLASRSAYPRLSYLLVIDPRALTHFSLLPVRGVVQVFVLVAARLPSWWLLLLRSTSQYLRLGRALGGLRWLQLRFLLLNLGGSGNMLLHLVLNSSDVVAGTTNGWGWVCCQLFRGRKVVAPDDSANVCNAFDSWGRAKQMLLSRCQAIWSLHSLPLFKLLKLHLGVPLLLQLLDFEELRLSHLVLLLLQHFVQVLNFDACGLLLMRILVGCGIHVTVHVRFHGWNWVAEGANSTLNQILDLLRNQYFVIVFNYLLVGQPGIHWMSHLVSKFESAFLFLLENMRAHHELLCCGLDQI